MPEPPAVRIADVTDAQAAARLLHDFNTEFGEYSPGVAAHTPPRAPQNDAGEAAILLGGAAPHGIAVLRFRLSLWSESLDAYLEELYVAPDRRGEGLGRALLEAALELSRSRGAG